MQPAPLGVVSVGSQGEPFSVDFVRLEKELRSSFPYDVAMDISFEFSDGRHLLAQVESALKQSPMTIDPSDLPDWVVFWQGPEAEY